MCHKIIMIPIIACSHSNGVRFRTPSEGIQRAPFLTINTKLSDTYCCHHNHLLDIYSETTCDMLMTITYKKVYY